MSAMLMQAMMTAGARCARLTAHLPLDCVRGQPVRREIRPNGSPIARASDARRAASVMAAAQLTVMGRGRPGHFQQFAQHAPGDDRSA